VAGEALEITANEATNYPNLPAPHYDRLSAA